MEESKTKATLNELALNDAKELDLPFIIVTGSVDEAVSVQVMKAGSHGRSRPIASETPTSVDQTGRTLQAGRSQSNNDPRGCEKPSRCRGP
jgi:FixJ family two-component response regulator